MIVKVEQGLERAIRDLKKRRGKDGIQRELKIQSYPKRSERKRYKAQYALSRKKKREKLLEKWE